MRKKIEKCSIWGIFTITVLFLFPQNSFSNQDISLNVRTLGEIDSTILLGIRNIWGWEDTTNDSLYGLASITPEPDFPDSGGLAIINCTDPSNPNFVKIIKPSAPANRKWNALYSYCNDSPKTSDFSDDSWC